VPVRRAAFTALAGLIDPPPEAMARLCEALDSERDGSSRCLAARALGELAASAATGLRPEALARLRRAENEAEDPALRRAARQALVRLESEGP
jgi:hypothetical protein